MAKSIKSKQTKKRIAPPKTAVEARKIAKAEATKFKERATKVSEDSKLGKSIGGFADFIRTQGIVGLAIGLAIGTQANATVKAIVDGFINPLVGFIVGNQGGLTNATWNVIGADTSTVDYWLTLGDRKLVIGWGTTLSSLITLLAVAAVIYFVVKGFNLDKIDKKKS